MHPEENALEQALRRAAMEPADRPAFFRLLLESTVLVLLHPDSPFVEGYQALGVGSKILIQNWQNLDGSLIHPFFSSLDTLQPVLESEEHYLALPARALFGAFPGASWVLNPGSSCHRTFSADEIEALLLNGMSCTPIESVVEEMIGFVPFQPSDYPGAMVASLTLLLSRHSHVNAAYLALAYASPAEKMPHLLIGIEADGDVEKVIYEAGAVAVDTLPGHLINFIEVKRGEPGAGQYFIEKVKPFYERCWGSKLKSDFGVGHA